MLTALPMRVIADSPQRTALYLAPGTRFIGTRTPSGGKIRDFSGARQTRDLVWEGGSAIRLIEPGAWHCLDVEFGPDGGFDGWYVSFQEPVRRAGSRFDSADFVLDLIVSPDRSCRLKDAGDFRAAVSGGHLTPDTASRVLAEADRMASLAAAGAAPFSETGWLDWRPPAGWTVPALPADWNAPA